MARQNVKDKKVSAVHEPRLSDCWYEGLTHKQLYNELIERAPSMHGPRQKKQKK